MVSPSICVARKGLLLGGLLLSMAAQATIDLRPKVAEVQHADVPVQIINNGDTPEFVTIKLYRLDNPGVAPEEELLTPLGLVQAPQLYVAPFSLSLGPHQQKTVHLKVLQQPAREQVYRLGVMPEKQATISGNEGNVMLLTLGYMGLVRHLPEKQVVSWQHHCEGGQLRLEATGTVRVPFVEILLDGQSYNNFNLYPGSPRQLQAVTLSGKADDKDFTLRCEA